MVQERRIDRTSVEQYRLIRIEEYLMNTKISNWTVFLLNSTSRISQKAIALSFHFNISLGRNFSCTVKQLPCVNKPGQLRSLLQVIHQVDPIDDFRLFRGVVKLQKNLKRCSLVPVPTDQSDNSLQTIALTKRGPSTCSDIDQSAMGPMHTHIHQSGEGPIHNDQTDIRPIIWTISRPIQPK